MIKLVWDAILVASGVVLGGGSFKVLEAKGKAVLAKVAAEAKAEAVKVPGAATVVAKIEAFIAAL